MDCLSDVQVAERKLFLIQGDKPQLMNWERYGLRIGVQEASLSSTDTVEAAVVALVGGQFVFPKNTVLVSAVYAVLVSKPLLKPLRLEIEHCVDLTVRPGLTPFLKFAIAPVSTPSLPYHFSIVDGGEFSSNIWYGSIQRTKFCLVCILGLIMVTMTGGGPTGGGGGGGQQQQLGQQQVGGGQDQQQQVAGGQDQQQQVAGGQDYQQQVAGGQDQQQQVVGGQDQQQQVAGGQDQQQQVAGGQDYQQQVAGGQDQQQQVAGGQDYQQQVAGGQDQQQQVAGGQDQQQQVAGGQDQEQQVAGGQDYQQKVAGGQDQQQQVAGGQDQQQQVAGGQDQQQQVAGGQDQQQQVAGGQDQQQQVAGGQDQQQQVAGGQDQQQQVEGGQDQQQQVQGGQDQQQQVGGGQDQQSGLLQQKVKHLLPEESSSMPTDTASSSTSRGKCMHESFIIYFTIVEVPTGVLEATAYAGLFFYNDYENLVTFTAAKDLNALLEVNIFFLCFDH